jgi:hypothetical protein
VDPSLPHVPADQDLDPGEINDYMDGQTVGACMAIAGITIDGESNGIADMILNMRITDPDFTLGQAIRFAGARSSKITNMLDARRASIEVSYMRNKVARSTALAQAGDIKLADCDGWKNSEGTSGDVALLLCGNIVTASNVAGGNFEQGGSKQNIKTMRRAVRDEWEIDIKNAGSIAPARLSSPAATPEKRTRPEDQKAADTGSPKASATGLSAVFEGLGASPAKRSRVDPDESDKAAQEGGSGKAMEEDEEEDERSFASAVLQ